jgi:hypothetical protein
MRKPILVTGSHRSGTTWVGRMLTLSREAGYIHEPLNPARRPGWGAGRISDWYLYVCDENEDRWHQVFDDVVSFKYRPLTNLRFVRSPRQAVWFMQDLARAMPLRLRRPRPLIKDPFVLFSAPWVADRFSADVVVTIRHPVAFIGSIKRLNWQFKFKTVLSQDLLLRDYLGKFESDMRRCRDEDVDIIEQGIVLWNAIHDSIDRLRTERPDWSFVRHEDLSADPHAGFRDLYGRCGLTWTSEVGDRVARFTSDANRRDVPAWLHMSVRRASSAASTTGLQRLEPDEVKRVEAGTREIAERFGYFLDTE